MLHVRLLIETAIGLRHFQLTAIARDSMPLLFSLPLSLSVFRSVSLHLHHLHVVIERVRLIDSIRVPEVKQRNFSRFN